MAHKRALSFALFTVFLDAVGVGLVFPIMPELFQEVMPEVAFADVAIWAGVVSTAFAAAQFLFGPIIGTLSDAYGRRPILIVTLFAMALTYGAMALAQSFTVLLLARIFGGITAATQSTASAVIADISSSEQKSVRFGYIGAAFGLGFIVGPFVGGFLAEFGIRVPFIVAGGFALGNALFGLFFFKETRPEGDHKTTKLQDINPFKALSRVRAFEGLSRLMLVFFLFSFATGVYAVIWAFYLTEVFSWGPREIGISLATYGLSYALTQALLVKPLLRLWGDRKVIVYGFILEALALFAVGFITNGSVILIFALIAGLGSISQPALMGIMSRKVDANQQGALQGVLQSLFALTTIFVPLLMTYIFGLFAQTSTAFYYPAAPFTLSGVLMVFCLMIYASHPKTDTN